MIKDAITRIIALVVVVACIFVLNTALTGELAQADGMKIALDRGGWAGGMDRLLSHANWMRLIYYRAKMTERNPDQAVVTALYNRYDTLTDQNPFMTKAYEHGGLELATMGQGQLALDLLDKGIQALPDSSWKIPNYAAYVAQKYVKNDELAEGYLEKARQKNGHPTFIESQLVRIRAKKLGDDPISKAKLWQKLAASPMMMPGMPPAESMVITAMPGYPGGPSKLAEKAKSEVIKLLRQVKGEAEQAKGDEKNKLDAVAGELEEILASFSGSGHICQHCYSSYEPGDKFCPSCGQAVEVFGVCTKCNKVLKPGEKFCPHCGTAAPKPATPPAMQKISRK